MPRIALLEMPPFSPYPLLNGHFDAVGKLSEEKMWIIPSPTIFHIVDSVITEVD